MESIWQWGIDVIVFIQQIRSPFFDLFFFSVSFFGSHVFYLMLLPFFYWCVDKKYASKIFILFLISSWSNTVMKDLIHHPRPFNLNEAVKIGIAGGYGIPSGHAQGSLVVGVSLMLWFRNRFFSYFIAAAVLLVALSRIYLGVHFPTDILGGWILGTVILILLWPYFDRVEKALSGMNPFALSAAAVVLPAILSLIFALKWPVMSMGALSGFLNGQIFEKKYSEFQQIKNLKAGILRYISGMMVLGLIFSAGYMVSVLKVPFHFLIMFILAWISGIWISAGAPRLFKKLGI
jgi:membrane-associated phospholipid phosphatase